MSIPPGLDHLASRQHGCFTRSQASRCDVDKTVLARWRRAGRVVDRTRRVLAFAAAPATGLQEVMVAVLDAGDGASAAHQTSLSMFGIPGFPLLPPQVLTFRARRGATPRPATVHTSTWIHPSHVTVLHGIPVTTPTRALFDLSGRVHPLRLERAIDAVWSRGLTSYRLLHEHLDDLARRGRPRIALMRSLLEARPPEFRPPESGVEARFQQLVRDAGILTLERQVDVGDHATWLGRADFRDREVPLVVQIDGDLHHRALVDARLDAEQTARLVAGGFEVLRVPGDDMWSAPASVLERVLAARSRARRRAAA